MAGALFHSRLYHLLPGTVDSNTLDLEDVASFQPIELRDDVISAVAGAIQVREPAYISYPDLLKHFEIQTIWVVCCPCLGLAFLVGFFFAVSQFKLC